jgi:hypothetical protein
VPNSARKNQHILLQNRNERGEISPGLEIALKLVGPNASIRSVRSHDYLPTAYALLISGKKLRVLWAPNGPLSQLQRAAASLRADWIVNWDTLTETKVLLRAVPKGRQHSRPTDPHKNETYGRREQLNGRISI